MLCDENVTPLCPSSTVPFIIIVYNVAGERRTTNKTTCTIYTIIFNMHEDTTERDTAHYSRKYADTSKYTIEGS